ncbi:MAG TPA: SHD1 domain-containing protein, partial [Candidatus Anammoximicrobium sp.]|nr:SHD1 domain-containing protein [Candidatus Anammoximicrobium sp.]
MLAVAAATLLTTLAVPATAEIWKDATGQFQVEAEFLGIRGQDLYLKKTNGVTIKVPLARLSAESQQLARQLAMPAAPAAPAVPAAPGAADTPVTAPMPGAADTPDAAARALVANLEAGNLRAVWDALPSRYQSDVNDLVHTFATNMDADVWKVGVGVVQKYVRVLKEKKEFILKQPALAQSPVDPKTAAETLNGLVEVLGTITSSDLADLEKLKTLEVGVFLDGTGKKVGEKMAALAKALDEKKL